MNSLVGKVGAKLGRLLKDEEFSELLSAPSVPAIASILRNTPYGDYIPQVEDIHRRELEASLWRRYHSEVESFKRSSTHPEREVFEHISLRCELDSVKKILRVLKSGEKVDERFITCDLPFDINQRDINAFVSSLSSRPYGFLLSSVLKSSGEKTIGRLENALDFWYFKSLIPKVRRSRSRRVMIFLKKQLDLMNAMWVYRGRVLLRLEAEAVLNSLLPYGFHLKSDFLRELASSRTADEFFGRMERTPYGEVFRSVQTPLGDFLMERMMERYMMKMARALTRSMRGFEMAVGYIHLLEFEIKDITTAIESVRYKLGADVAREYLIREWESA